jgi:hypothetical protein
MLDINNVILHVLLLISRDIDKVDNSINSGR